jgi:prevent-host-death family protein
MHIWPLHEAKAKLTQLLNEAKSEPQIISRHGVNEMIVLSLEQYESLLGQKDNIVSFFKNSPLYGVELDLTRDKSGSREVDL